ncbi:hypothetical protein CERZMDRAFT_85976 [Cercospora zeae-maydis SCOH1-5]|uniref:Hydrophobin n=1 Tax=Cercospora zeae-maydis SCOH1-5 TaxID=717836 RepID=A0A6A6FBD4_9PEZI|nr:hypothetical protein CERZMDRAFT_85976 [Cercospora zeae-maydis SCOH1-5]
MQRLISLSAILLLILLTTSSTSSPVVHQARQANLNTTYIYTAYSTLLLPTTTAALILNITCPTLPVSSAGACPTGCTAIPCAGLLGIATDRFDCAVETPRPAWTSWIATNARLRRLQVLMVWRSGELENGETGECVRKQWDSDLKGDGADRGFQGCVCFARRRIPPPLWYDNTPKGVECTATLALPRPLISEAADPNACQLLRELQDHHPDFYHFAHLSPPPSATTHHVLPVNINSFAARNCHASAPVSSPPQSLQMAARENV